MQFVLSPSIFNWNVEDTNWFHLLGNKFFFTVASEEMGRGILFGGAMFCLQTTFLWAASGAMPHQQKTFPGPQANRQLRLIESNAFACLKQPKLKRTYDHLK